MSVRNCSKRERSGPPLAFLYSGILSFVEHDAKRIMSFTERINEYEDRATGSWSRCGGCTKEVKLPISLRDGPINDRKILPSLS